MTRLPMLAVLICPAAAFAGAGEVTQDAFGDGTWGMELLSNGGFEAGDTTGWEQDASRGRNVWQVKADPVGHASIASSDGSLWATPFHRGAIWRPGDQASLMQGVWLADYPPPTIDPGGELFDAPLPSPIFDPNHCFGLNGDHCGGPNGDPTGDGGGTGGPGGAFPTEFGSRARISVEAIFSTDLIEFAVQFRDDDGVLLAEHLFPTLGGYDDWETIGENVLIDEVVPLPAGTGFVQFTGRSLLNNGVYMDSGFDRASVQVELVPAGTSVPEPASLAVLAAPALLLRRRR